MVAVIEAPEHQTLLMQQTFRAVLTALSEPLRAVSIPALPTPLGTTSALWAMALTLWDQDVSVWWPEADDDLWYNTLCHTRVMRAASIEQADWVVLSADHPDTPNRLGLVSIGVDERPDQSASVLLLASRSRTHVHGAGPGLLHPVEVQLPLPEAIVDQLMLNHARYPLGFDTYVVFDQAVMGLPRSTRLTWGDETCTSL